MIDRYKNLPLLEWTPACRLITFPPGKQVGIIRQVAAKWLGHRSSRQADAYAIQVDDEIQERFSLLGILPLERKRLSEEFWNAVRAEIAKQRLSSRTGGSAA
ncbi:MAG: hypothetical protein E5Y34_06520 [Mesorhizobium sp.]|uniref:DUF6074 family protein n=1 Tax=Mesorhizobium sp. TaxID=1871066 RepID=UPI0012178C12|nr:DUF6074 family protein [Mesorhizobium sp.]TIN02678.1 MAG: hypothetical protein E5Y34_06520 [Mesorhizobium sp.]